jgi:hypothetical protein
MKKIYGFLIVPILAFATVSQANQETWIKMFNGLDDKYYRSSGVTDKDTFMFSAGCTVYTTRIRKNRAMAKYFINVMLGMGDRTVSGWSGMTYAEQQDFVQRSVGYAHHVLEGEIKQGNTNWQRVDYLCKHLWQD